MDWMRTCYQKKMLHMVTTATVNVKMWMSCAIADEMCWRETAHGECVGFCVCLCVYYAIRDLPKLPKDKWMYRYILYIAISSLTVFLWLLRMSVYLFSLSLFVCVLSIAHQNNGNWYIRNEMRGSSYRTVNTKTVQILYTRTSTSS